MANSSFFDAPASLFDNDESIGQQLSKILSPTDPNDLVPKMTSPPPNTAPQSAPGQSTPRTGSLDYPPQQAQPKRIGPPMLPGIATQPEMLGVGNALQPVSTRTRSDGLRTVVRDLNGRPAGSALSTFSTARPGMDGMPAAQPGGASVAPLQPAMNLNAGLSGQQVNPAQPQASPLLSPMRAQPVGPQPGSGLAGVFRGQQQAYNTSAAPAQYSARMSPVSTDQQNPDPNGSLRPAGRSPVMPLIPPGAPQQVNGPSQLDRDQSRLAQLTNSGSGVSQIKNGFWRGAARVGDATLSAILPTVAPLIGGTTAHNQMLVGRQQQIVGNDQAQEQATASAADVASQTAERTAKAQQDLANAGKADRYDPNAVHTINTGEGVFGFDPDNGTFDRRIGSSPEKALPEGERPLGSTIPNLNKTLQDRYQVLHPGQALPSQYTLPATATQKDYERIDKALGGVEGAEGTHQQQQQTLALRQQALAATEAARAAGGSAALDRETARFAKPYEKANEAASAQLEKIDDAANMIGGSAEAQALGIPKVLTALVGGQGTGVRITTPELNAIASARGWVGDFQGTLNSISGKGKLTSTQQQQLKQILNDVKARITQKRQIANDALDKINGGATREDVIAADKEARQRLTDLESGKSGSAKTNTTSGGFNWDAHPKVNP